MKTSEDPLDWKGKKPNWVTGQPYSEKRNEWAAKWSTFPLYSEKAKLVELSNAFKSADVTILTSGTGSGKTVLAVPLMLKMINSPTGSVLATMPKRATVLTAAKTGAMTLDVQMGEEVGYRFRSSNEGDRTVSARRGGKGRLMYATDGYVLAQSRSDPMLLDYDAIIIDEAHERGVPSDMLILAVLRAQQARKKNGEDKLRFVIMSATIDPEMFEKYFAQFGVTTKTIHISGEPLYPVERQYVRRKPKNVVTEGIQVAQKLIEKNARNSGKILFFVPTTRDALSGCDLFRIQCKKPAKNGCEKTPCAPLYGKQSQDQQMEVLSNEGLEGDGPLIVATNVAESSLTIKDIRHVIDSGLQLNSTWLSLSHGTRLSIDMASQAQISQRVGRTGRTGPGTAYLMYTKAQHDALPKFPPPAIAITDITDAFLSEMIVDRKTVKETSDELMQLLTPPTPDQLKGTIVFLRHYRFIDPASDTVSKWGRMCTLCMRLTQLDIWNALLVARAGPDLTRDALLLCSVLEFVQQGSNLWHSGDSLRAATGPPGWMVKEYESSVSGDHEALLRILKERVMEEGNFAGLARGTWEKIRRRAKELTRDKIVNKCIDLFTSATAPQRTKTIQSVILDARSFHRVNPKGKPMHIVAPSKKKMQMVSWFGGNKARLRRRHFVYETLVINSANSTRLSILTWE